jgi:hypothetical protein
MNITLSLDEKLVKEVRKIAVERDTTLTGLVREYLEKLTAESAAKGRQRRTRSPGTLFRETPFQYREVNMEARRPI